MADQQIAVVTGASAGVGRATAVALARRGYAVALLARGEAGLQGAATEVRAAGGRPFTVPTDVADPAQVEAAATRVEVELGPIDLWVNNAMATVFAWSWDVEPAEFKRTAEVTYLGQVHGTLAALARMRPRDRGRIVNVGSALAYRAIPLQSAYCAAKFAARGFTESVRCELLAEGSGVTITMVHLPAVNTPQFDWVRAKLPRAPRPVAPVYRPEEAAAAIVTAAADGRRMKVMGAWTRAIMSANRFAPGILDHYAARTAVSGQQSERPLPPDRPDYLDSPLDDAVDHGTSGRFGDEAGGVLDRAFLRTLPQTGRQVAAGALDAARFTAATWRRRWARAR